MLPESTNVDGIPDARALIAEMASHSGPEPRFIERCRAYLAATLPASDAAVPAGEVTGVVLRSLPDDSRHLVVDVERGGASVETINTYFADGHLYHWASVATAPKVASDTGAGLPDRFEAWWATYRHRNRDQIGYALKKQIAFDAFEAAALATPTDATDGATGG